MANMTENVNVVGPALTSLQDYQSILSAVTESNEYLEQIRKTATEKAGDMTEASLTYLKQEFSRLKVEYNALQTKHRFMQRLQDIGDGNNLEVKKEEANQMQEHVLQQKDVVRKLKENKDHLKTNILQVVQDLCQTFDTFIGERKKVETALTRLENEIKKENHDSEHEFSRWFYDQKFLQGEIEATQKKIQSLQSNNRELEHNPSLADPKNEDFKILQHVRVLAQIASDDMMSESLADELENETALIAQLKARLNMVKDQAPLLEEIDNETQFVQELTDTYEELSGVRVEEMGRDLVKLCFLNKHFLEIKLHNALTLSETRINLDDMSIKLAPSIVHQEFEQEFLKKWEKACKVYEHTTNWKDLVLTTVSMMDDHEHGSNGNLVR